MYFYAGRAFAGDRWSYEEFDNSPDRQRKVVDTIKAQSVPIVFVDTEHRLDFSERWPALMTYLDQAYTPVADVPIEKDRVARVLTINNRAPSKHVSFEDLPCFAP